MKKNPLVSFIILNWNGLDDTKMCISSVRDQSYKNIEIVVVDNGSEDGSKDYFSKIKDIVFVSLDKNEGFTGGHIRGYESAKGEYIAIINNDLVLDRNWLSNALKVINCEKNIAVVGGKQFKWNDVNPAYDERNEFFTWQEVDANTGYTRTLLTGEHNTRVDSISGAALLIKSEAISKVGYFDNDFFAYYEETDLIARLIRAGYLAYYAPECKAWHKVAASSEGGEESYFYLYMMHRNRYMFAVKNLDREYLGVFINNYKREYYKALISNMFRSSTESRARIDAYRWNMKNKAKTLEKRETVMSLGDSYVKNLPSGSNTDVTVIIPCYNYGNYVGEAIDSVLNQTLLPNRIIVIDDGSTDNSLEVIKGYANNPIVEIVDKPNEGVIKTKNLGLKMVTTYWVLFFDADDLMLPSYLEEMVKVGKEARVDVVYSDMKLFDSEGKTSIFSAGNFSIGRLIRRNFIHNSALIKTTMARIVNGYKLEMKDGLEDWELYLSMAEAGAKFAHMPQPLFLYRQHSSANSRNAGVTKKEKELYQLILNLHPRLKKYTNPLRRYSILLLRVIYNFIVHPSLLIALFKSLPKATLSFFRTIAHELRIHRAKIHDGMVKDNET